MDTPTGDTAALLAELEIVSEMIRARTKRAYKEAETLWRLGAKQESLVKQLTELNVDTQEMGHNDSK